MLSNKYTSVRDSDLKKYDSDSDSSLNDGNHSDSGFVSYGYKDRGTMDQAEVIKLSESLIRCLNNSNFNNLETSRTKQTFHQRTEPVAYPGRFNVRCSDAEVTQSPAHILEQPFEFFYTQDHEGDTLLHVSIVLEYTQAAFWLIELAPCSSFLDILNFDSQTALHLAVMARQAPIARRLVLAGADVSIRTATGNTAVHLACSNGDADCVKALTEPFAEHERVWLGDNSRTRDAFIEPSIFEIRNYVGETCLHIAAAKGHADIVELLIRAGANANAREGLAGKTALHLAIENGQREVVHFLGQEHRTCLETPTYAGATAYQLAEHVDRHIATDLLRFGANELHSDSETSDSCPDSCSDSITDSSSDSGSSDDEGNVFASIPRNY